MRGSVEAGVLAEQVRRRLPFLESLFHPRACWLPKLPLEGLEGELLALFWLFSAWVLGEERLFFQRLFRALFLLLEVEVHGAHVEAQGEERSHSPLLS